MIPKPSSSPRASVGSTVTPMLRAVLLADLVDSTAFIERFGDARAAVALQRLDLQIRDLLEFTGGRLIDKADGLLAIFERPIQAVDFALRYQQALRHFSSSEGSTLTARVGIHVGELMTWSNTDHAVAAGAKPLEVEGLAKPVAARLMSLALPGQILISSMAQSLAQRAQAELGERTHRLRWMVHGRYRFKGVPAPLLVHEVGEVGFAPLVEPPSGQKVWRELPVWRRPPVVAAEILLFLGVATFYGYAVFRSPPAISFQERDWIVIGDVSNFTGDPRLEESLDVALRVGLEQSRHVNILSDLKVRDALERMGRSQQATIDRAVGSEIAMREGARALLLPSVTEVGGRLRVSIEIVDPNNQTTVFARSAEGRGAESALTSLDNVSEKLRAELGESLANISARDKPLAQVTTSNLDALRAYSLATAAYHAGRDQDALALFEQALLLDPDFAMAQVGVARVRARNGELALAHKIALSARSKRARMSHREALDLDSFLARFGSGDAAMQKFKLWATIYPDSFRAYYGYSLAALENNHYEKALESLKPALSPKNPNQRSAYFLQGAILLPLNRFAEARTAFQRADALGAGGDRLEVAEVYAAERDFAGAARVLRAQRASGMAGRDVRLRSGDPLFLLDRGRWTEAIASLAELQKLADASSPLQARAWLGTRLAVDDYLGTSGSRPWTEYIAAETRRLASADEIERGHALFPLLAGGWIAARNGDIEAARRALAVADAPALADGSPAVLGMRAILQAQLALAAKKPDVAITLLRARQDGTELYFSHALLMRAYAANGNFSAALAEARWLESGRGRAYGEWNHWGMWNASNVVESNLALLSGAEFAQKLGQHKLAQQKLQAFLRAWPQADQLEFLAPRLGALRAALEKQPGQSTTS